ncbi:MAG: carbamoyltransferase C-terminal domain-containing protein, partial [Methanosarcinales archaeon]
MQHTENPEILNSSLMETPYVGPSYSNKEIKEFLDKNEVVYSELDRVSLLKETAKLIADKQVVGWFQGRMEWGPRALGNRSIL